MPRTVHNYWKAGRLWCKPVMESWMNGGKMKDGEWLQVWNGEDLCACAVAGEHVWEFTLVL